MTLGDPRFEPGDGPYRRVILPTNRGDIECHSYPADGSRLAALFVGGAGGGFDTPVRGWLYPRLCEELPAQGIAALRVRYRHPAVLEESTLDVLAGVHFLAGRGARAVALVGHSFGGAVVIQAAAHAEVVRAVAPLSTQSFGAGPAAELSPRCSILLMHGTEDEILAPACSRYVYGIAGDPKRMILLEGTRHGLDEAADEVHTTLLQWLVETLRNAVGEDS
jgi:pimeloyl-ACP methyl ester carboxylesterase